MVFKEMITVYSENYTRLINTKYIKIRAFYDVEPCSLVGEDRRLRGAYCLHHHRPDDRGSMHLWNVGLLQQDYTVLYPRRL
jgi:hypothetical protein